MTKTDKYLRNLCRRHGADRTGLRLTEKAEEAFRTNEAQIFECPDGTYSLRGWFEADDLTAEEVNDTLEEAFYDAATCMATEELEELLDKMDSGEYEGKELDALRSEGIEAAKRLQDLEKGLADLRKKIQRRAKA